ncbi:MFS general substrate transporter [Trametes coccinea BRFM310]|uniref:MFS general substrate transporter n=1 Tax=Trametes coccinea (strain BRFM310) TaxID=1353009 RepID=A0A1Y2J549_TRAC3|nr:MFS general substrate transporter [Trametes coccinea BRFM310]
MASSTASGECLATYAILVMVMLMYAPVAGSVGYKALYPDVNESQVLWKIDLRVVPVISVLYLLAFLDRINVSNAVLFNLKQDLNLTGNHFIPYILFEIPSNMLLKRFKPHIWLPLCMVVFGVITILQGFTHKFSGLYRREEAQKRFSLFYSSTTLAGAFGGLLASAIGKMDGMRGYHGWRWIFILEGTLTAIGAALAYLVIPDFPEDATWLAEDEKEFVKARLYEDVGDPRSHDPLTVKSALSVFKDYKVLFGPLMYLGVLVPSYSCSYFAPTIIQTFGHSTITTQLLSVPPAACASVATMLIATASDRLRRRFVFLLPCAAVALVGFLVLLVVHDAPRAQYAALYLAEGGAAAASPIVLCWFETNLGNHHRRAVGTAAQIGFGNIGGIIAAYSFLANDSPRFLPGFSICLGFTALAMVAACGYYVVVAAENRRRDRLAMDTPSAEKRAISAEERERLGDLNPEYRYFT